MPLAAESASATLAQELTEKVRDRGLVLWVDAERQFDGLVDALAQEQFGLDDTRQKLRALVPVYRLSKFQQVLSDAW